MSVVEPVRWPDGSATGVGSMPGVGIRESLRLVLDTLADLPHLPELPERGPGSAMVGRALATLPDFPAAWGPTGWALTDRPGRDIRAAVAVLGEDLDTLEEMFHGWTGPMKVQMCGPWTLATSVELRSGRRVLADLGARRDLHQGYAEAVARHVAEVLKRLPGVALLVQLDEPALPHVLYGEVPSASGLTRLAAVDQQVVLEALAAATSAISLASSPNAPQTSSPAGAAVSSQADAGPASTAASRSARATIGVHCCAASPPLGLLRELHEHTDSGHTGLDFASVDATVLTARDDDALGEAVETGLSLFLGVDATAPQPAGEQPGEHLADREAARLRGLWNRLGLAVDELPRVVVTPRCGLAGAQSAMQATAALVTCREVARKLRDDPRGRS